MATASKQSLVKARPSSNQEGSSKGDSLLKIKKIESSIKQSSDSKHKSVSTVTKTEVSNLKAKVKSTLGSSKTRKTTTTSRVREKKVYTLPGQKYDPPEEREPLRIFYESLSKQIPSSEMAEFWMMEHGLLSSERAKKANEKKQRKQKLQRTGTPVKSPKPLGKPESSNRQQQSSKNSELKVKKRIINENDNDDDFIIHPKRRKGH